MNEATLVHKGEVRPVEELTLKQRLKAIGWRNENRTEEREIRRQHAAREQEERERLDALAAWRFEVGSEEGFSAWWSGPGGEREKRRAERVNAADSAAQRSHHDLIRGSF